jgi:hypothetical protein
MAKVGINQTEERKKENLNQLTAVHPHIFDGICRPMASPACHFELKEGAIPAAIHGSRPVSVPLMPRLKQELGFLEKQEIIQRVTKSTARVHPMVLATNKDGGIRVCVDFTILNHNIIRPRFDSGPCSCLESRVRRQTTGFWLSRRSIPARVHGLEESVRLASLALLELLPGFRMSRAVAVVWLCLRLVPGHSFPLDGDFRSFAVAWVLVEVPLGPGWSELVILFVAYGWWDLRARRRAGGVRFM